MPSWLKPAAQVDAERLEQARAAAADRLARDHRDTLAVISAKYPETEQRHWHALRRIALSPDSPALARYAEILGVTPEVSSARILAKADGMDILYAEATATITLKRDALELATTIDEILMICPEE